MQENDAVRQSLEIKEKELLALEERLCAREKVSPWDLGSCVFMVDDSVQVNIDLYTIYCFYGAPCFVDS